MAAPVAYNRGMGTLLKFLALANALAMALPLGWCCPTPATVPTVAEAAGPAACPNCHPRGAPQQDNVPAAPDSPEKCPCCQVRAASGAEQVSLAPAAQGWMAPVAAIEPESPLTRGVEPTQFIQPGPALQILHCVWRC